MTPLKLSSTTMVLSLVAMLKLMASLSQPVLSMKTGYVYSTNENPTIADQYRDLKCTYLHAAVTHMRLVKHILEDRTVPTNVTACLIVLFKIRAVICTLYDVPYVKIGSLWFLLFYANTVQTYSTRYIYKNENDIDRMAAVDRLVVNHGHVTSRLQRELSTARCRPGNAFDSYEIRCARQAATTANGHLDSLENIRPEATNNCNDLKALLDANNANLTFGKRHEALSSRNMFLKNLGNNDHLKSKLMTGYDLQVSWNGTFDMLNIDYQNVYKMYSPTVLPLPFFSIIKYYRGVFDLFICIVYRLTWKFLLYVNGFTGQRRVNHLETWQKMLVDGVQKPLCLQNDRDFMFILGAIDKLIRNAIDIDSVTNKFETKLHRINVSLECVASNPMTLGPNQFYSNVDKGTSDTANIDWNSIKNLKSFIDEIQFSFKSVDFDIIQSFVKYINDEINR